MGCDGLGWHNTGREEMVRECIQGQCKGKVDPGIQQLPHIQIKWYDTSNYVIYSELKVLKNKGANKNKMKIIEDENIYISKYA